MSLLFYAYGEPKFVFVMLLSICVNWGLGLLAHRFPKPSASGKAIVACMAAFNLSLLFAYKYLNFAVFNANRFFHAGIGQTDIVLPIGISFFTFQAMSYVVDVYRGNARAQKNPLNTALYIALFPQLIAGPIVRYETIAEQIGNRSFSAEDFSEGVKRFVLGLAKKSILANSLAVSADQAFGTPAQMTVLLSWIGIVCYALQIYFDFSGYSDMAIGLGRMFGFRFHENFNYPYISRTVTEFWRRWHISLSGWFRDYVYIPLGGSRVGTKSRLVFNLFVVWTLTGVWHGASWNFVFWGLFYFLLLTFEKLLGLPKRLSLAGKLPQLLYRVFTILCFLSGWVLFRADGLRGAMNYLSVMFAGTDGRHPVPLADAFSLYTLQHNWVFIVVAVAFSTPILKKCLEHAFKKGEGTSGGMALLLAERVALLVVFGVAVAFTVSSAYNPFIYFNF
jgi:alginate O-acetyltransferase complex protein AlgI